jgi:hypothetical protein
MLLRTQPEPTDTPPATPTPSLTATPTPEPTPEPVLTPEPMPTPEPEAVQVVMLAPEQWYPLVAVLVLGLFALGFLTLRRA